MAQSLQHQKPRPFLPIAPILLGLVGPSGSGKTTVCEYLIKAYRFHRIHIARPVKAACEVLTGLGPEYFERPLIDEPCIALGGVLPRAIAEHIGTKMHEIAPLSLPLQGSKRIEKLLEVRLTPPYILVDGIRRLTEGNMVRSLGGKIIRRVGSTVDPDKPCDLSQLDVNHDYVLQWAPTKEGLYAQIDEIMAGYPGAVRYGRDA